MDNNFTGDYEFFQECEDARVERFEMFDVETVEVEDADAGDIAPDNEFAGDDDGDDVGDGWSGEWG